VTNDSLFDDADFAPEADEDLPEDTEDSLVEPPSDICTVGGPQEYSFYPSEQQTLDKICMALRSMLTRPNIEPEHITTIGRLLFALHRIPLLTTGVSISVSLKRLSESADFSLRLSLDDERFYVEHTGLFRDGINDPEGFTEEPLTVGLGWRGEDNSRSLVRDWIAAFEAAATNVEYKIETDDSGVPVDWELVYNDEYEHPWWGYNAKKSVQP
jgi:hypothetical protein